jgi:hypothetical protein
MVIATAAILTTILEKNAYAYLDPGTMNMLLQLILLVAASVIFALKKFWRAILNFIVRIFCKNK